MGLGLVLRLKSLQEYAGPFGTCAVVPMLPNVLMMHWQYQRDWHWIPMNLVMSKNTSTTAF